MKKLLLFFIILFAPVLAQAQNFTELQVYSPKGGEAAPLIQGFGANSFENFGVWHFYLVSETWAEALVGLSKPLIANESTYMEIGAGLGIEHADNPLRTGAFAFLAHGKSSLFGFYEYGGSGRWYLGVFEHYVLGNSASSKNALALGIHAQRYNGIGPRVQYRFQKIQLWGGYVYDHESDLSGTLFGLRVLL